MTPAEFAAAFERGEHAALREASAAGRTAALALRVMSKSEADWGSWRSGPINTKQFAFAARADALLDFAASAAAAAAGAGASELRAAALLDFLGWPAADVEQQRTARKQVKAVVWTSEPLSEATLATWDTVIERVLPLAASAGHHARWSTEPALRGKPMWSSRAEENARFVALVRERRGAVEAARHTPDLSVGVEACLQDAELSALRARAALESLL
eukprot:tig00021571_g22374.t1